MTTKSVIKPWAIDLLLRWNDQDPVSQKEIARNNAIYNDYQHNRNPFVDHPEYARMIWDSHWSIDSPYQEQNETKADRVMVYDLFGRLLIQIDINEGEDENMILGEKLNHGCYLLQFLSGNQVILNKKLLVN